MPVGWNLSSILLAVVIATGVLSILMALVAGRKARAQLRAHLPASPLQILDRRLASGEISVEEYRYERYVLEKGE